MSKSPIRIKFRFERLVNKGRAEDACDVWMGSIAHNGYGLFKPHRKTRTAHKVAYELYVGEIPPGMCVMHRCQNRACVNPRHFWLGTQKENIQHACREGRMRKKLSAEQVHEIRYLRKLRCPREAVAEKFGVSVYAIQDIDAGVTWAWLK